MITNILIPFFFFLTGATSLIYQVVWVRQFQNIFGSTSLSVAVVICSFFSGLSLGSFFFGQYKTKINSIKLYAILEGCIGIFALLFPLIFMLVEKIYLSFSFETLSQPVLGTLLKFLITFLILILPCTLMGGTLPLLSQSQVFQKLSRESSLGKLYALNVLGAVLGVGSAGFILIEKFGISKTIYIIGTINLIIAAAAYLIPKHGESLQQTKNKTTLSKNTISILCLYGLSGMGAIALEILWTRSLILFISSSVYSFSSVLIIFLLGNAIGSGLCSWFVDKIKRPLLWFGSLQITLALFSAFWIFVKGDSTRLGHMIFDPKASSWFTNILSNLLSSAEMIFIPTIIMGALFPLALKSMQTDLNIRKKIGLLFGINTLGGIFGSILVGFVLIPLFGIYKSILFLCFIFLLIGLISAFYQSAQVWLKKGVVGITIGVGLCFFIFSDSHIPSVPTSNNSKLLYFQEDHMASVAVYENKSSGRVFKYLKVNNLYLSGGTDKHALMVQRRQGHLPVLLHKNPKKALVIGLATGITLSAVAEHGLSHIDCIELIPSQLGALNQFSKENFNVLQNKKVNIRIDDGRNFIKNTSNKYDIVISDLFQVSSMGTGNMYTEEHIANIKKLLNPGGLTLQWLAVQQFSQQGFKSAINNFVKVFPHVQLWYIDTSPNKSVIGVLGSLNPLSLKLENVQKNIEKSGAITLQEIGYTNPYFVISQCIMETSTLKAYSKNAIPNTYDFPSIEYFRYKPTLNVLGSNIINGLIKSGGPLKLVADKIEDQELMVKYSKAHYFNLLSQLASQEGNFFKAEKILQRTLLETPKNPDTKRLLSRVLVVNASDLMDKSQPALAIQKLDSAELLGEDNPFIGTLRKLAVSRIK